MPWKESSTVDQRTALVNDWLTNRYTVSSLAEAYGVSRQKAHKWLRRFREEGRRGLEDRSRAPKTIPSKTSSRIKELVVRLRKKRPRWGAPKILAKLGEQHPDLAFPSERTVHSILVDAGLVLRRRRPRRVHRKPRRELATSTQPNDVWCVDFKGDFRLGNGTRCHPLTVTDHFSRYLLVCRGLERETLSSTQETLTRAFKIYGLPTVMRSDNGRPFGSGGPCGLSKLSVWLIKLGVSPEHIDPSRPDQNGRHERMHRTLKDETARPPKHSMRAQQLAFTRFTKDFNEERPHQALGQIPPTRVYESSPREYPRRIEAPAYPGHFETRYVRSNGEIQWKSRRILVGAAFHGEYVGLEEIDEGLWLLRFADWELGVLNDRALARGMIPRIPSPEGRNQT